MVSFVSAKNACRVAAWLAVLLAGAGHALAAESAQARFDRWFAIQTNIQTWSADVIQTRSLKILAQPLVSTGKVWVITPNRFRWELGQPAQTIALRNRDQLLVIYPRLKRAERYAMGAQMGPWRDIMAMMDASFPRDRASLEGPFRMLSTTETNAVVEVALQPKSAAAARLVSEIRVSFHTNDFSLAATELRFPDGSRMRNDFFRIVVNQPVDPRLFEENLGPEFTVAEPLGR